MIDSKEQAVYLNTEAGTGSTLNIGGRATQHASAIFSSIQVLSFSLQVS